jgi:hypothetical protein
MDQPREDFPPRVSVESVQDWSRIKTSVSQAALAALDSRLSDSDTGRDIIAAHVQHVSPLHLRRIYAHSYCLAARSEFLHVGEEHSSQWS